MRPKALFNTVVIAGVGLLGGSVGLGVRQRFLAEHVIGFDQDPQVLERARALGVIDEAKLHAGDWLQEADLVILASPASTIVATGKTLARYTRPDTLFTDVGSTKAGICAALAPLRFVGGHPMAGSERGGVEHAGAALLENAVWVLTPTAQTHPQDVEKVKGFVTHLGAHVIETSPEQHDRLVAAVSHLPYLSAVALTELAAADRDADLMMLLAAGGFRDLTRVASGSPRMSRDMVVENRAALRETIARYQAHLQGLERLLDDPDALLTRVEMAKRARDSFPIVRRSLLSARFEVVIAVPDKPGELARITQALGDANVNVKDIEVLTVREAGGALRLAFDSEDGLKRGTEALTQAGYEAR